MNSLVDIRMKVIVEIMKIRTSVCLIGMRVREAFLLLKRPVEEEDSGFQITESAINKITQEQQTNPRITSPIRT